MVLQVKNISFLPDFLHIWPWQEIISCVQINVNNFVQDLDVRFKKLAKQHVWRKRYLWWRGWASSSPHAPSSTSTGGTWPLSQMEYSMIFSGTWEFLPYTLCTTILFWVDPSPPWPLQPSSRNKLIHGVPGGEGLRQAAHILWPPGQAMVLSAIRLSRW